MDVMEHVSQPVGWSILSPLQTNPHPWPGGEINKQDIEWWLVLRRGEVGSQPGPEVFTSASLHRSLDAHLTLILEAEERY